MTPSPAPAPARSQVKHRTGARAGRVLSREIRVFRAPTLLSEAEGNTHRTESARRGAALRGRRPRACTEPLCARTGRSPGRPPRWHCEGTCREGHEPQADNVRPGEVRRARSTDEVAEQGRFAGGGGDGGKEPGRGEHGRAKRAPDTVPDQRAQCAHPCA